MTLYEFCRCSMPATDWTEAKRIADPDCSLCEGEGRVPMCPKCLTNTMTLRIERHDGMCASCWYQTHNAEVEIPNDETEQ